MGNREKNGERKMKERKKGREGREETVRRGKEVKIGGE